MAQNMILFQPNSVPAHIAANAPVVGLNANAQQGVRLAFPVVSIEGRIWSVMHRGIETVIKASEGTDHQGKPLPEAPVRSLNVVVVGISPVISKAFYLKAFQPGVKVVSPDCFSTNGESPDPASPHRQSELCATCPKNQFESAISDDGTKGRGKACRDGRKIAIVPAGDIQNAIFGGPMMLRLPVMSIPNLAKYCGQLTIAGYDITQVVTSMSFNMDVRYPEVVFQAVGFIQSEADYFDACDWAKSDVVRQMLDEAPTFENTGVSPIEPTREQFDAPVTPKSKIDHFRDLLTNTPDPDNWMATLTDCVHRCDSMSEVMEIRQIESVAEAGKKAPLKFRRAMTALWDEASARFAPAPVAQEVADDAGTPPAQPKDAVAPPAAFAEWLIDGEGDTIPLDEDGTVEQFTDPVAFARAFMDARANMFPGDVGLFEKANHDALRRAMIASTDVAAILAPKPAQPPPAASQAPAEPTLPLDMPEDAAIVARPVKPTKAEFDRFHREFEAVLANAVTPDQIHHARDVNEATYNAFPPRNRTAALALIEAREKAISPPPPRNAMPSTLAGLADSMLADIASFETSADVRQWHAFDKVKAELARLRAEDVALYEKVQGAANSRLTLLVKAEVAQVAAADPRSGTDILTELKDQVARLNTVAEVIALCKAMDAQIMHVKDPTLFRHLVTAGEDRKREIANAA